MKLVIDISHNLFESLIKGYELSKLGEREMRKAIQHGKSLPEHHGNLKDADKMMARLCKNDCKQTNGECKYFTRCSFWDAVQEAETIIPATKEGGD